MKLTREQIDWLNKCTKGTWTLNNKTGLVDVDVNFFCNSQKLEDFKGVRFGTVTGSFDCSYNKLTSLEGAPQKVGWSFDCSGNKLTSLVGAPQEVRMGFYCYHNQLTSLEGAPQAVGGDFSCHNNNLTSLTLEMIWEVMKEKKIDYWSALCILKKDLEGNKDWKLLSKELDENLSRDAQKGIGMMSRFGHFE